MSKQLANTPCTGCKFFSVHPTVVPGLQGIAACGLRPLCMNDGNMCNDFSCYREGRVSREELVSLLSEGVNVVRAVNSGICHGPWVVRSLDALDRE